ncbi:hypothetical protein [Vreelandella alkaliphila]|uniref:hypothetical protein n=1 Tax=Vreelandella alkaliphila TaxID=272774 RepID=UPI002330E6D9|nr:hypothetical protein [Halomonas alkaliphila]
MLNTPLSDVDHVARPIVAIGTDYRPGTLLDFHTHRRAQFLYGMSGVMEVNTDDGTWMVPPCRLIAASGCLRASAIRCA